MTEILTIIGILIASWCALIALVIAIRPGGLDLKEAALFVPQCLLLLKRLIAKSLHGWPRLVVVAAVIYLISPIDLVPDFIPVVGVFDDVIVAVAALRFAVQNVDRSDIENNWTGSSAGLALILRRNQTS